MKNQNVKNSITTLIALTSLAAGSFTFAGEKEKAKPATSPVSVTVIPADGKASPLTPEENKKMLEALGGDKALLKTVVEAIKKGVADSKSQTTKSGSVSVVSSAYIVGPDGKLQKIDAADAGSDVKISDDTKLNSVVKSISMTLAGGKGGTTIDMQTLKDLNISGLVESAVSGSQSGGFSNQEIQTELAALKKELAEQRKLLNKIYKKLEEN